MRASIARALVTEPQLLLMDEPFAALDEITRFRLNNNLLAVWQELRRTVIFVTHSVFESVFLSQRIVVMTPRPGRVFTEITIDAPYPRDERFRTRQNMQASAARWPGPSAGPWEARHERRCLAHWSANTGARGGRFAWEVVVRVFAIPPYVLPAPFLVLMTLIEDGGLLWNSLMVTCSRRSRALCSRR